MEGDDRLLTRNASSVPLLFQNKVMFLLKIMLIDDEALLSGQPPLSGHFPAPRGWPLNCGSTGPYDNTTATLTGTSKKHQF